MPKTKVHLVCNAHLDPVWLWEWEEGAAETLATFRTAADLSDEFPGFVFNHNEAILYRWVEAYEPALFRRIRKLVRRGRWHIMGGWHLQPDCNIPAGESIVRQILLGRSYFKERFGVAPTTAVNLDPFGHSRGFVQILAKSGYDSYLFCRPSPAECPLPAEEFVWSGFDGSRVLAVRATAHYNSALGRARAKVETWLKNNPETPLGLILWGVGDHGGGASRKDLADLAALAAESRDALIVHSTPEAYMRELAASGRELPVFAKSLNPWAPGCYTSMARVKQAHRRLENELFAAEKTAAAAFALGLTPDYPKDALDEAFRDMASAEFHDILPGSSIEAAEESALRLLGHGREIAARVRAGAFFALAAGEAPAREGEIPVFVYNPHPWAFDAVVDFEFEPVEPNTEDGYLLPRISRSGSDVGAQPEREASNLCVEWRKRVVFAGRLLPSRLNRFDCRLERVAARPGPPAPDAGGTTGDIVFARPGFELVIGRTTGLVERYRAGEAEALAPGALKPLVIEDDADCWSMKELSFRKAVGAFTLLSPAACASFCGLTVPALAPVRVIEAGPVRTVVEALFGYGRSVLVMRYKVPARGSEIEVDLRVRWAEKDRFLKLALPCRPGAWRLWGQVAYGREELFSDGREAVAQKWLALVSGETGPALTLVNDGIYGADFDGRELRLSLLRAPAYAADPDAARAMREADRFIPRHDQGERSFRLWISAGPARERLERVEREALERNETPFVLPFSPAGGGRPAAPVLVVDDPAVVLTALKKSEAGRGLVLRLFEPTGRARTVGIELPFASARTTAAFAPFEIKTILFDPRRRAFREADLLERPLEKGR
ncbi:MAG: alpha-mannosidase [Candidatus Aminicenantes bacterium]|nr:alpha-mannosidase [Candidatus Aminicenantes bacterium]